MPNSKSAEKRNRQNQKRRDKNRVVRSRLRTYERKFREALEEGELENAEAVYHDVVSELDIAARKGVIPKKRASRHKSRLAKQLDHLR